MSGRLKRARSNDLAIRVTVGERIGMNKAVIRVLDNPAYLNFWWGSDEKVIGISKSDEPTGLSVPVPAYFYKTGKGAKVWNVGLMEKIKRFTGWEDKTIHLMVGEFVSELRMVVFRMDRDT